jgi:hypothetical protein
MLIYRAMVCRHSREDAARSAVVEKEFCRSVVEAVQCGASVLSVVTGKEQGSPVQRDKPRSIKTTQALVGRQAVAD